jgi:hypothetical protein
MFGCVNYSQQAQAVITRQGSIAENELIHLRITSYQQHRTAHPGAFPQSTFHTSLEHRLEAFHKPFTHVIVPQANFYGHHHREPPIHECVAWRLAHAIGGPLDEIVAPTVMRFHHKTGWGSLSARQVGVGTTIEPMLRRADQSLAAAFFDSLIGQQDRHLGNFRWDAGTNHLGLIDHGFAFALPGDEFNESCFVQWRWSTGQQALEQWERDALDVLLKSHDLLGLDQMLQQPRAARLQERAGEMVQNDTILPYQAF